MPWAKRPLVRVVGLEPDAHRIKSPGLEPTQLHPHLDKNGRSRIIVSDRRTHHISLPAYPRS